MRHLSYSVITACLVAWCSICTAAQVERPPSIRSTQPVDYPQASRRFQEEGTAVVHIRFLADGSVAAVSVAQSSGYPRLDDVAVKYARSLEILPGVDAKGHPSAGEIDFPVDFKLSPASMPRRPGVRGYIGIEVVSQGFGQGGDLRVTRVIAGGPAEQVGIRVGDIISAVNDYPASGVADFIYAVENTVPGEVVALTYQRTNGRRARQNIYADEAPKLTGSSSPADGAP